MGLHRFTSHRCSLLSRMVKQIDFGCKLLSSLHRTRNTDMNVSCRYVALEIKHSGAGFHMADSKRVNKEMFSFNPNELHGGGGSGGGTGSGLGAYYPFSLIISD